MKTLLVLVCLVHSCLSFGSEAVSTREVDKFVSELVEGDTLYDCQQDVCKEYVVKKKITLNQIMKNAGKIAIPATALAMIANLPGADGGPIAAGMCPAICPALITFGCSPFGQALIIDAIGFLTAGAGFGAAPAVIAMCSAGLAATGAGCDAGCIVVMGIPAWP